MSHFGTPAQIIVSIAVIAFLGWQVLARKRKPKAPEPTLPKPLERWEMKARGPWRRDPPFIVEILDVKEGWVLFGYVYVTKGAPDYVAGREARQLEDFLLRFEREWQGTPP